MSNVLVEKQKIDILANAISDKSGEPVTMTLAEMVEAVDSIDNSGITPVGNIDITQSGTTDVTSYATATVPKMETLMQQVALTYTTENNQRKCVVTPLAQEVVGVGGFVSPYEMFYGDPIKFNAIASGTTVTPTESSQTVGGANTMMEGAVTVNAIPSNYVGSGITQRSSSDLTASGATVTAPAGYYSAQATKTVASGTAGTPVITKGTPSRGEVRIDASVTNTTGFIIGDTIDADHIRVDASELVSGSLTIDTNDTYDVTYYSEVVVNVGGSTGGVNIGIGTPQSGSNKTLQFDNILGTPTSFHIINSHDIAISANQDIISALTYDGTNYVGQVITNTQNAQASYVSTGFSYQYNSSYHAIMIMSDDATFDSYSNYIFVYTYGGTASDIHTADVQVGSGATSITFPVSGRPTCWSCVFKSNFGTSSGYQRVIAVANDGLNDIGTYGLCLDSSAHSSDSLWTATYSGGNFTISSQGTNAGGYFHQPGYYQLTYAVDDSAPSYQTKSVTYTPTTSTQTQTVTADTGYDALEAVNVTVNPIPSQYVVPTGNLAITSNGTNINVSNYATVSVNVPTGGGVNIDTKTVTASNYPTSLSFTGMKGEPKAWFLKATSQISSSGNTTYYYIITMRYNGTNTTGSVFRIGSTRQVNHITSGYSWSYSGTTLTITSNASSRSASPGAFNNGYELVYVY